MKKGEIWRVLIPAAPGHAQTGERPAIILQELAFNNSLPTTLIVPLTSKLAASRFDGTLVIQPDQQNGLTAPRLHLCFKCAPWTSELPQANGDARRGNPRSNLRPVGRIDGPLAVHHLPFSLFAIDPR